MTFHPTNNPVFWKQTADELLASSRFEKAHAAYLQLCELTPNDAEAITVNRWQDLQQQLGKRSQSNDYSIPAVMRYRQSEEDEHNSRR